MRGKTLPRRKHRAQTEKPGVMGPGVRRDDGEAVRISASQELRHSASKTRVNALMASRPGHGVRLLHPRLLRREFVDRGAELAGHLDLAVLHHAGAVFWRKAF